MTGDVRQGREVIILFGIAAVFLVISGIGPVDRATWWLEVGPVIVGIPLLLWLRPRFPFTPLLYRLLFIHACLSFCALFEMFEWWVALIMGGSADAFLALQGDVWDTQWDMFLALCGATISLLLLTRLHDRHLYEIERQSRLS